MMVLSHLCSRFIFSGVFFYVYLNLSHSCFRRGYWGGPRPAERYLQRVCPGSIPVGPALKTIRWSFTDRYPNYLTWMRKGRSTTFGSSRIPNPKSSPCLQGLGQTPLRENEFLQLVSTVLLFQCPQLTATGEGRNINPWVK